MAQNQDEPLQVLIPYKTLCQLLEAPKQVEELRKELRSTNRQLGALRGQLFEVIEKMRNK